MKARGEIATGTLLLIGLVAVVVGLVAPKPKFLDKGRREADQSKDASERVEQAVAAATSGMRQQGAAAAASVQQMVVAAGQLPDSPQRTFIVREGSVIVPPLLPPPDPSALLAAERRRVAILEGKIEQAEKLYGEATKSNAALIAKNEKLSAKVTRAFADRREMDGKLAESAAYAAGMEQQRNIFIAVALLGVAGWAYVKFTGLGWTDVARMANRVKEGVDPIHAIDATVPDWMHTFIEKRAAKLRAKEAAKLAARKAAASS